MEERLEHPGYPEDKPKPSENGSARSNGHHEADPQDWALIQRIRANDEEAFEEIIGRYRSFIWWISDNYYFPGADPEDVRQEALIGLMKATRDYQPGHCSFDHFARLAMERNVISRLKSSTRKKHGPLNESASFEFRPSKESSLKLQDILPNPRSSDPCEVVIGNETLRLVHRVIEEELSEAERESLVGSIQGVSYLEIAAALSTDKKSVDNAVQRARRKIAEALANG